MEIAKVVGFALVAAVLLVVVRRERPELAVGLSVAAGAAVLLFLLPRVATLVSLLEALASRAHVQLAYLDTILRIIGVAYLTEFGAQVCRDAGEAAIAAKVELAGKVLILLLALPIVGAILEIVLRLLS